MFGISGVQGVVTLTQLPAKIVARHFNPSVVSYAAGLMRRWQDGSRVREKRPKNRALQKVGSMPNAVRMKLFDDSLSLQ
jgi:hypothetical protein